MPKHTFIVALCWGAICEAWSALADAFHSMLLYVQRRRLHAMLRCRLQLLGALANRSDSVSDPRLNQQLPQVVAEYLRTHIPKDMADPVRCVPTPMVLKSCPTQEPAPWSARQDPPQSRRRRDTRRREWMV